jgi:hypothetical protein
MIQVQHFTILHWLTEGPQDFLDDDVHFNFVRHFYTPPTDPGGRLLPDLHPLKPEDLVKSIKIGDVRIPRPTTMELVQGDMEYRLHTKLGHSLSPRLAERFGHDGFGSYNEGCSWFNPKYRSFRKCGNYPVEDIAHANILYKEAEPEGGCNGGKDGRSNGGQANGVPPGGAPPRSNSIHVDFATMIRALPSPGQVLMLPLPMPMPIKAMPAATEVVRPAVVEVAKPEMARQAEVEMARLVESAPAVLRSELTDAGTGALSVEDEEETLPPSVIFDSEDHLPLPTALARDEPVRTYEWLAVGGVDRVSGGDGSDRAA